MADQAWLLVFFTLQTAAAGLHIGTGKGGSGHFFQVNIVRRYFASYNGGVFL